MKIAIDLDGVVMRSIEAWLEQFHPDVKIEEIVYYDVLTHPKLNIIKEQFHKELEDIDHSKVKPVNGAIQGIHKLIVSGHNVFFLTAKKEELVRKTINWLEQHELGNIRVVFDSDKSKYKFDYLLDDNPEYSKDPRVIILNREWNKDCSDVNNWTEFVKVINNMDYNLQKPEHIATYLCLIWKETEKGNYASDWEYIYESMTLTELRDYIKVWKIGNPSWKKWIKDFKIYETPKEIDIKVKAFCEDVKSFMGVGTIWQEIEKELTISEHEGGC